MTAASATAPAYDPDTGTLRLSRSQWDGVVAQKGPARGLKSLGLFDGKAAAPELLPLIEVWTTAPVQLPMTIVRDGNAIGMELRGGPNGFVIATDGDEPEDVVGSPYPLDLPAALAATLAAFPGRAPAVEAASVELPASTTADAWLSSVPGWAGAKGDAALILGSPHTPGVSLLVAVTAAGEWWLASGSPDAGGRADRVSASDAWVAFASVAAAVARG